MKNLTCRKMMSILCAFVLLAAAVVTVWAEGDVSVQSPPSTDGRTCTSCGTSTMVATGGSRTAVKEVYVSACVNTSWLNYPHYHIITTVYATYVCSTCGSWGEKVTYQLLECRESDY